MPPLAANFAGKRKSEQNEKGSVMGQ